MDSDGSARPIEMPASKIIPYLIHTHSHFLAMRCELPLGNLSLILRSSLNVITMIREVLVYIMTALRYLVDCV